MTASVTPRLARWPSASIAWRAAAGGAAGIPDHPRRYLEPEQVASEGNDSNITWCFVRLDASKINAL
jgi:hypothetical protein